MLRYRTLDCGREVALQVSSLLTTLQTLLSRPDQDSRTALLEASRRVANASYLA